MGYMLSKLNLYDTQEHIEIIDKNIKFNKCTNDVFQFIGNKMNFIFLLLFTIGFSAGGMIVIVFNLHVRVVILSDRGAGERECLLKEGYVAAEQGLVSGPITVDDYTKCQEECVNVSLLY